MNLAGCLFLLIEISLVCASMLQSSLLSMPVGYLFLLIEIFIHSNKYWTPVVWFVVSSLTKAWHNNQQKDHNFYYSSDHHHWHTTATIMSPSLSIRTTANLEFEQAQKIYDIAGRFLDVIVVLQELRYVIGDCNYSRNRLFEKSAFVKKSSFPLSWIWLAISRQRQRFISSSWHQIC